MNFNRKSVDQNCNSLHMLLHVLQILNGPKNHSRNIQTYFKIAKFHEKLFKARKVQRDYNEKQNEFDVKDEQTKELENKLEELEKKLESTLETTKKLDDKLEQLEEKLKSNFRTTSTQTKELNYKLDEILKLLKPE